MKRDGFRFLLRVPDADDLLSLDQHPPALLPFGQEPPHVALIEVPFAGNGTLRIAFG